MPTYTPEEQKEHRRLWVQALRSGEYEQCREQLHTETGYCCLGVACDISGLGEWGTPGRANVGKIESETLTWYILQDESEMSATTLPDSVMHWLGFSSNSGVFNSRIKQVPADALPEELNDVLADSGKSLAVLNDRGFTFHEIADIIEAFEPWAVLVTEVHKKECHGDVYP